MTGTDLRARRNALGLSQPQLAAALSTTKNTVARWERGEQSIPGMLTVALAYLEATITMNPERPAHDHARCTTVRPFCVGCGARPDESALKHYDTTPRHAGGWECANGHPAAAYAFDADEVARALEQRASLPCPPDVYVIELDALPNSPDAGRLPGNRRALAYATREAAETALASGYGTGLHLSDVLVRRGRWAIENGVPVTP